MVFCRVDKYLKLSRTLQKACEIDISRKWLHHVVRTTEQIVLKRALLLAFTGMGAVALCNLLCNLLLKSSNDTAIKCE
jgi:hypothetical protein